jgi:hypothetical protein
VSCGPGCACKGKAAGVIGMGSTGVASPCTYRDAPGLHSLEL